MRIGAVADTHGVLPNPRDWTDLDLFIHAGDAAPSPHLTEADRVEQRGWVPSFAAWLDAIPARDKVFVPGNHDFFVDDADGPGAAALPRDVHVLRHDAVPSLGLFGSAWTYWDTDVFPPPWAYGASEDDLAARFAEIPDATELLVCHSGARGALDNAPGREVGSTALAARLGALPALKLMVHGHAHEAEPRLERVGDSLRVNVAQRLVTIDWSGDAGAAHVDVRARLDAETQRWT